MEHTCNEKPEYVSIMKDEKWDTYRLCIEDYGDWSPINYCPYCGEKLVVE